MKAKEFLRQIEDDRMVVKWYLEAKKEMNRRAYLKKKVKKAKKQVKKT